jgi:hypothetical protein
MTTLSRLLWAAAAVPLLIGCTAQDPPLAGPLELRVDHHAQFELLPPEDVFRGFGVNCSLSADLALPVAGPAEGSSLNARLTRFEYTEPAGFPGIPFTIHDWQEVYPRLRPPVDALQDVPLRLSFGEAGTVASAEVVGPDGANLLTSSVVPDDAEAVLADHMPAGLGMSLERERLIDALARRWAARFDPGPLGAFIGRHMVLAPPEGGWAPGAQTQLEGLFIGDLPLPGGIAYTVTQVKNGRAHLDIAAEAVAATRRERLLLPLGMAEPSYEGEGSGWAVIDTATNRILRQFFVVEGSGVFEVLMVKHEESIPFSFRLSVASELERRRPEAEGESAGSRDGAEAETGAEPETGGEPEESGEATPQNGA